MIIKQFVDLELHRAVRKALGFWYDELSHDFNLMDFIHKCSWKMCGEKYIVIYRGPLPKENENAV